MPRGGRDRLRFDLAPPVDGDLRAEVDRLLALGATRLGTPGPGSEAVGIALADPDGNEFRLLRP